MSLENWHKNIYPAQISELHFTAFTFSVLYFFIICVIVTLTSNKRCFRLWILVFFVKIEWQCFISFHACLTFSLIWTIFLQEIKCIWMLINIHVMFKSSIFDLIVVLFFKIIFVESYTIPGFLSFVTYFCCQCTREMLKPQIVAGMSQRTRRVVSLWVMTLTINRRWRSREIESIMNFWRRYSLHSMT